MPPLRLLHCLTHSSLGGGQELVFTLVDALRRGGTEIGVMLPGRGVYVGRFHDLGVAVYEVPLDRFALPATTAFRRALASFRPHLIHSHGKGAGLYARTLTGAIHRIHSYHGFFPPGGPLQRLLYVKVERSLLRRTSAVIAVSESEAVEVGRVFPEHAHKVVAIPNVIDRKRVLANAFAPLKGEVREFVAAHRDGVIVTMVAREDPAKNYPLAVEACATALAARGSLAVMFIGAGDTEGVRRLRRDFPGRFLAVPRLDSVGPVIMASGIVLLTSVKEGGRPLVLQEAFALGKPVVATDVPGIRETVRDGVNGILCAMDPASVTAAILRLASSESERTAFGERAGAGAAEESLEAWADLYRKTYLATFESAPFQEGAA